MFSDGFNSYQSLFRSQQVRANTLFSTLTLWHHLWDRKCSWNSDVFHSNETLLSAGLVSAPCSADLQQYACSSVRSPWIENWNRHNSSWTLMSTAEICVCSSQASLLETWLDSWSVNYPAAEVTPRRSGNCFSPKQMMFWTEPSSSSPAQQQIW